MSRHLPRRVIVEETVDLPHVPPGEIYQTTCRPHEQLVFEEVLVRDFTMDSLLINNVAVTFHEHASHTPGTRAYRFERWQRLPIAPGTNVLLNLRNATDRPLPVRQAIFEENR